MASFEVEFQTKFQSTLTAEVYRLLLVRTLEADRLIWERQRVEAQWAVGAAARNALALQRRTAAAAAKSLAATSEATCATERPPDVE